MPHAERDRANAALAGNSDAPREIDTPRRPGQPGEQAERRPGPNPLSRHQTGPNPPYDPSDTGGVAADKHERASRDQGSMGKDAP